MLDNFRKVGVVWNHSTNQIYQRMRVASSDDRGRKLVVQITNDHVIQDTSEVELRLYWEIKDKKGFNDFTLIDAEHGIYEIYFSRGMLENKGTHKAWLHATDTTGSITSEAFGIEVFKGIDLEAVEGTDDFSALNSALARVITIESQEEERQANETAREQAESTRVAAENTRKSAEETREANEDERKMAETAREKAETGRESAESTRQSNETNRQNAEANRQETFETNEANRQTEFEENESIRQSNEQTRQTQEATRQTNESSRQAEFEDMKGQVDDLEETYAPRLNEIEDNLGEFLVSVKAYGAKGDGITKDYNAIQAALDDVYQKGGGYVYIPSGHYIIESRLEIGDNTHLFGAGKNTLLDGVSSSALPQGVSGLIINKGYDLADDYAGASNFSMRNFAITSSDEERQGIYLEGATEYYISDITSVGTCKDHWFDINNTKNGVFERLWLNKPNSSIFQMDVRINGSQKGPGNNGLVIRDVFMEDMNDQSNYGNNNFRQSGFHFHRGSCKNIYISNVISENVHTLFYKDAGIDVENLNVRDVKIDGVYHTFFFEHGTSQPSDSYKDLIIENFDVTSESSGRGLGWFGAVQNLKVKNFKLHTNSFLSDRNGFVSFGIKSKNISLENLDLSGEAFDNDTNTPLWNKSYFTETMKEAMFKSLKGTYTYEFEPTVLGISSGYADQRGLLTFNNGDIHLNIRVNHPSITSSSDYLAIKGYPTLFVDDYYSRFMGVLGYLSNSAAIRKSATILTPYIRDLDEGLLIRKDYGNYALRSDAAGLLDINLTIEIQGKSWN